MGLWSVGQRMPRTEKEYRGRVTGSPLSNSKLKVTGCICKGGVAERAVAS